MVLNLISGFAAAQGYCLIIFSQPAVGSTSNLNGNQSYLTTVSTKTALKKQLPSK